MKILLALLCLVPFLAIADNYELNCQVPGSNQLTPCRILGKDLAAKNFVCFNPIYNELNENITDYVAVNHHVRTFVLKQYISFYGRQEAKVDAVSYYFIHGDCNYYDAATVPEEAAPIKLDSDVLCSYNYSVRSCTSLADFQNNSLCVKTTRANYENKIKRFLGKNHVAFTSFGSWNRFGKKLVVFRRADGTGRLANLVPICGQ